mgnify:CR=1 FL=1
MPAPTIWATQPFKALYIAAFIVKTPIKLILLSALYLFKRPLPGRSIPHNLVASLTRMIFDLCAAARLPYLLWDDPKTAKEQYVLVEPAAAHFYAGPLSATDLIKPAPRPLVWLTGLPPKSPSEVKGKRIVLQFFGGAFVVGLGYKHYGPDVAKTMKNLKADYVVWADYRLANESPETGFPAAIQDAVTYYSYLLSLGFESKNIILTGDSSGGNIVLTLLRYLNWLQEKPKPVLPLPGGVVAFSPWVHITPTVGKDFYTFANCTVDTVTSSLGQWGSDSYRPSGKLSDEIEAFISPLHHPFKTAVPLYIHDGDAEVLYDNINLFARQMKELNGDKVRYYTTKLGPHDLLLAHPGFGMTKELYEVVTAANDFIESNQ